MASRSPIISSDPLAGYFESWRNSKHTALIPYLTAGYPEPGDTVALLRTFAEAGADLIELGVPFSDPVADGPTIQRSSQAALEHHVTLASTLDALAQFRSVEKTPVLIFSYLNPVLSYGAARFVDDAVSAGAEGVLLVDLPLDADPELELLLEASPLSLVRLLAPTTAPERASLLAQRTQGFLYYVARLGVTGAGQSLRAELLQEVRSLHELTDKPIAVGFGISNAEQAAQVARAADGVVVGSALIDAIDRGGASAAAGLLRSLREGLDQS